MNTAAIIAEYNPFHNGHKYMVDKVKQNGYDGIIAIMSGNFVQRGEPAFISKYARTKMAIENGIDLVVELPLPYAMSTAANFAFGAADIINNLNIDCLSFGSESNDISAISQIAELQNSKEFSEKLKNQIKSGETFAKCRQRILAEFSGNAKILENANDSLAVEYVNAFNQLGNKTIEYLPIQRVKIDHDSQITKDKYCSASYIRQNFDENANNYMPKSAFTILQNEISNGKNVNLDKFETSVLTVLRTLSIDDLKKNNEFCEGLENRFLNSVFESCSLEELYSNVKCKRYTLAKIRRLAMSAYLGIDNSFFLKSVPYIRVLGYNNKGLEIIKQSINKSKKPIIIRPKELLGNSCFELELKADNLYNLILNKSDVCNTDLTNKIIKFDC